MRKIYNISFLWLFVLSVFAQNTYLINYYQDVGNPGTLNTETDNSTSGWTTIINGGQPANTWSSPISIPFSFNFYGFPVSSFRVSANGILTFATTPNAAVPDDNVSLPSSQFQDSSIAVLWDKFTVNPPTGSNDRVYYKVFGSAPNRQLWIKWYSMEYGNPTNTNSSVYAYFACVLEEGTNKIYVVDYNYHFPSSGFTTTVGVQLNSTTAVQYSSSPNIDLGSGSSSNSDNDYYEFSPFVLAPINLATTKIISPEGNSCFDFHPTIEVVNLGTNDITGFDLSYKIDGGSTVTETYSGTLLSGDTLLYTFTTPTGALTVGSHIIDAWVTKAGDADNSNDSIIGHSFNYKAVLNVPHLTDFETSNSTDSFYTVTNANSNVARNSGTGNSSTWSLRFTGGSSTSSWVDPTSQDPWTINGLYSAKAVFCVDATSLTALKLKFDLRQEASSSSSLYRSNFRVVVNGTQVSPTFNPQTTTSDPYVTYEYNLSSFTGGIITVEFESRNRSTSDRAYLDNVYFFVPPPDEAKIVEIVQPSGVTCGSGGLPAMIKFINNGINTISTINVGYQVNTNTPVIETVNISPALAPGNTFTYTFTTPITTLTNGSNTIKMWVSLTGDPIASNDTITTSVFKIASMQPNDVIDFESYNPPGNTQVLDSMFIETQAESNVSIDAAAANNSSYGLLMTGNTFSGFTTPSGGNEWLINETHSAKVTFCIDATAVTPGTPLEFRFDLKQTYTFNTAYSNFRVLINGTQIGGTYRPTTSSADPFITHSIDVSSFAGQIFNITFETRNKYSPSNSSPGDNAFIDNINLYMPLSNDVKVVEILSPTNFGCGDPNTPVVVVVENNGLNNQTGFNVTAEVSGATTTTLTGTVSKNLAFGALDTLTLGTINTSSGGNFTIKTYTQLAGDQNNKNDTISPTIYIRPLPPGLPVSDTTVCGPQKILFDFTSSPVTYLWYDDSTATTPFYTGNLYLTGLLNNDTTFYIAPQSMSYYHVGPPDNNFGGGWTSSYFSNSRGLKFDAYANITIDSIRVYPDNASGNITITLEDNGGNTITTKTINIPTPTGDTVVYLGISVPAGNDYNIYVSNSSVDLFYNSSGASYPYELNGLVKIKSTSNGNTSYYYFLYDWVVSPEPCAGAKTPLNVYVLPEPNANLGKDTISCSGPVTLDAGNPGATYLWSTGATTQTITYSGIGDVWVEVSYAPFCKDKDTVSVAVLDTPQVNLQDQTVCGGVVLDATNPFSTYQWNTGAGTPTITVTTSGIYYVTVTNACGWSASDTANITVNPGPFFDLGPDTTICQGSSLTLSVIPNPNYQYSWNTGATSSAITVTSPGQYILSAVNPNNNCSYSDTINVSVAPIPNVYLGQDTLSCGVVELDAGNPGATYKWNTGATTQKIDATTSGSYSVIVTNASGCSASDTINVVINNTFYLNIGPDTVVCSLPYTVSANYSPATYLWSTGDTTQSINIISSGTYWVKVWDGNGCMQKDTITIKVQPTIQEPFSQSSIDVCDGTTLDAKNYLLNFLWNTGDTTQTIFVNQSGQYWVEITSACGDVLRDTITVNVFPTPQIPLPADTSGCDTVILDAGNPGASFLWNTGATTQTIAVTEIGFYSVQVTNPTANCSNSKQIFVNVYPTPQVDFALPDTYFVNQYISTSPSITPYAQNILWNFGPSAYPNQTATGTGQVIFMYPDTGKKAVTLYASNGNCKDSLTKFVVIIPVDTNTSISKFNYSEFKVYPNPATDYIIIEGNNNLSAIAIYSVNGTLIKEEEVQYRKTIRLDLNNLSVGNYVIKVVDDTGNVAVYKLIKQQ